MNHIGLQNLPRLDFCLRWFTGKLECFAKATKRSVVAAKANLFSGLNLNPLRATNRAHRRDTHANDSNSHQMVPFRSIRNSGLTKKPLPSPGGGFQLAVENFVSAIIRCTSNQKHSFLIQGTLPLHLVGCRTPFSKSFLMLRRWYQIRSASAIIRASERPWPTFRALWRCRSC
jgi:hypothetical protein